VAIEGRSAVFRDKTLLPKEGIRLAALGLLASDGAMGYAVLAQAVRQFTGTFWGPTLDVMSSSIELLRFEGLIDVATGEDRRVTITEAGRAHLIELLESHVRSSSNDFNKLVVALKLRNLHLLPAAEQGEQLAALAEARLAERARLADLRAREGNGSALFLAWLDHEIAGIDADIAHYTSLRARIG
jgi:DNA-binding PadR family transcriptional regulator